MMKTLVAWHHLNNVHRRLPLWLALSILCGLLPVVARADFGEQLERAALERTRHVVRYDGAYLAIGYPGGDVPAGQGVCTDVVIRSYRALGVDLQQLVHEDMRAHFDAYPSRRIWGLRGPDANIDHRRVPNLQAFFSRHGKVLPVSSRGLDYRQGDLVTWMVAGNLPHIGIVTGRRAPGSGNPMIVHNIGRGPVLEDMLFEFPITGHYRYESAVVSASSTGGVGRSPSP